MKHKIASDKGRVIVCRFCNAKEVYKTGSYIQFNFDIKKFQIIKVIPNLKNSIKRFFQ